MNVANETCQGAKSCKRKAPRTQAAICLINEQLPSWADNSAQTFALGALQKSFLNTEQLAEQVPRKHSWNFCTCTLILAPAGQENVIKNCHRCLFRFLQHLHNLPKPSGKTRQKKNRVDRGFASQQTFCSTQRNLDLPLPLQTALGKADVWRKSIWECSTTRTRRRYMYSRARRACWGRWGRVAAAAPPRGRWTPASRCPAFAEEQNNHTHFSFRGVIAVGVCKHSRVLCYQLPDGWSLPRAQTLNSQRDTDTAFATVLLGST